MLVDVEFYRPRPPMDKVLAVIGGGHPLPTRLDRGMYLCRHWSIEQITAVVHRWKDGVKQFDFAEYGVCDTPQQVVSQYALDHHPLKLFVSYVKIERATQESPGGWRWHKWGPYIGNQKPQCEYIADEPEIEEVYTFHVYEPLL